MKRIGGHDERLYHVLKHFLVFFFNTVFSHRWHVPRKASTPRLVVSRRMTTAHKRTHGRTSGKHIAFGPVCRLGGKKGKGSPYSIAECRVPVLIPVLGSQPAGDVSHKPGGRLPLLSARPAVTPTTLKRAATSFAAW